MLSSPTTNETNLLKKSSSKGDVEKESQPLSTDSKKFSIIIPAYNEENRIKPVLEDIVDYITQNNLDWDIILAIDGNDGTDESTQVSLRKVHQDLPEQHNQLTSHRTLRNIFLGMSFARPETNVDMIKILKYA